jgi:hypothetical protein
LAGNGVVGSVRTPSGRIVGHSEWDDCKKLWGKDATVAIKNPDGSKT